MGKLSSLLNRDFLLMVSLPKNNLDLAEAAYNGGADAIKVHINVYHHASGTRFKSWKEEKKNITEIIKSVPIPVGLLPGANENIASPEEIKEAKELGISFLDGFAHFMPCEILLDGLDFMVAVNKDYPPSEVSSLTSLKKISLLEATLLPPQEYGKSLTLKDIALYKALAKNSHIPVMIPTQKNIKPQEVVWLKKAGAKGIIIGAVVTGLTPEKIYKTTKAFRDAINGN